MHRGVFLGVNYSGRCGCGGLMLLLELELEKTRKRYHDGDDERALCSAHLSVAWKEA